MPIIVFRPLGPTVPDTVAVIKIFVEDATDIETFAYDATEIEVFVEDATDITAYVE